MGRVEQSTERTGKRSPRAGRVSGRVRVFSTDIVDAHVTRLFHLGESKDVATGTNLLRQSIALLGERPVKTVLLAGAGIIRADLPEPTVARLPDEVEFAAVAAVAQEVADAVRITLPTLRPVIVFGVDVYASCARSEVECQVGQFAVILPTGNGRTCLFPKRYPTPKEPTYLRIPEPGDSPDPICSTPHGRAAVLVCHDVNAYSARGEATTTYAIRADWRAGLKKRVAASAPAFGLHLAHYVESPRSFRQAYGGWAAETEVPLFGASGLPSYVSDDEARRLAASLLIGTDDWPVMDLCETRGRPA